MLENLGLNVHSIEPAGHFASRSEQVTDPLLERQEERRRRLRSLMDEARRAGAGEDAEEVEWLTRSYPILAVLAPVMSSHQGKIEFPGDPMCLYSALSLAVSEVLRARDLGLGEGDPYNDLCPRWSAPPSPDYRLACGDETIRELGAGPLNTDQTVFDPRVWNEAVRAYLANELLAKIQPRVVLISTVSPGHRYAIAIAREVRRCLPEALIVLGGRHIDETMRWDARAGRLNLAHSSTLRSMDDGKIDPVFDFVVSGDGHLALDVLLKAISLAMDLEQKRAHVAEVVSVLRSLLECREVPGHFVIAALEDGRVDVFPVRGSRLDLSALPSPYRFFAIRARFPIFRDEDGNVLRTAQVMVTNACPFRCNFCSEAVSVVGKLMIFEREKVHVAVDRVLEYVSYGAEALFFDDSVFWAGSVEYGTTFCRMLSQARREAARGGSSSSPWLWDEAARRRLVELQWGAQLTAEYMTTLLARAEALRYLREMRDAGCNYIYIGIESLASAVMTKIHKNLSGLTALPWSAKIVTALELAREAGVRVGASILFGLEGETAATIEETIDGVAGLLDRGLLSIASPNILTYHPGTAITASHGMEERLDYHSLEIENRPPYVFFEEAFPSVVSRQLSEDDIWYIHRETQKRWGSGRNSNPMPETRIPLQLNTTELATTLGE